MAITLDGTNGITSPGGDVASVSVATPILKSSGSLTLQTNGSTTALTVDTSQNVIVGATSNLYGGNLGVFSAGNTRLDIATTGATTQQILSFGQNGTAKWQIISDLPASGSGRLDFVLPGTGSQVTINSSGNVGIGTTSPGRKLEIYASGPAIKLNNGTYNWTVGTGGFIDGTDSLVFYSGTVGDVVGRFDGSSNFKFNSGYGSVATAYGCRAWVNFDGTTSPGTIRGSGNVSSVTKNGTGDYTINFTNSMTDGNYVGQISIGNVGNSDGVCGGYSNATRVAGSYRVRTLNSTQSSSKDFDTVYISVFR
jgi:hypothetical protein